MTLVAFRRFPLRQLRKVDFPVAKTLPALLFQLLDRGGWLSDFAADPQTLYEKVWPHRMLRSWIHRRDLPTVSVVLATRNNEATIESAVHSVRKQRGVNVEIIVIDDCSTDSTLDKVERLAHYDSRIKIIRNETQLGTGASRNRGLQAATGQYVTFQDGDDVSMPGRLAIQAWSLKVRPNAKICLCNYARVNAVGRRLVVNDTRINKCIISMMFPRAEVLDRVGFFMHSNLSEDSDFYERIKLAFGPSSEILIFRTLYHALLRSDSSFFSAVEMHYVSKEEVRYIKLGWAVQLAEEMRRRHERMVRGEIDLFVPPSATS